MRMNRYVWRIIFLLFLAIGYVGRSEATQGEPPGGLTGRRVQAVGPWAYKRLERAHQALAAERTEEALEALAEMKENDKLNEHETSLLWQTFGFVYSSMDKYSEAADSFERSLEADGLAEQAAIQTRYNLAQLYVLLERYDNAIEQFDVWFANVRNPSPSAYYMLAMAYLQKGERDQALRNAERSVELSASPREPWLQLLVTLHLDRKEYQDAVTPLEVLVTRFPKKEYWIQLSALHSALGEHDKALAALELAHEQGLLTKSSELMTLAQLYLYNQIPYKAAVTLQHGLDEGTIASNARAWQLLADSWLNARDRERALGPLTRAAEMSLDGDAYVRLGQLQLEREDWNEARQSFRAALQKGGLRSEGQVYVLIGIAGMNDGRWQDAEEAFSHALSYEQTQTMARHWLNHLATQKIVQGTPGTDVAGGGPSRDRVAAGMAPQG